MTRRDDRGAALVLALVFLSFFGIFLGSLLSFSDAGLRGTQALRDQRARAFAADAAVEARIETMRGNLLVGRSLLPCPDFTMPSVNGVQPVVTCQPESGSGVPTGGSGLNVPAHAILTLSTNTSGEDGVYYPTGDTLRVGGDVTSNSDIVVTNSGQLISSGQVRARGPCQGNIQDATPPVACNQGPLLLGADDPNYPLEAIAPPPVRPVPSCNASNDVIVFEPGTYTDGAAMETVMKENGSCDDDIRWFKPGVYYFDFTSGTTEWKIDDPEMRLVAGEPKGWNPASSSKPSVPYPGGCKTDADGATDGVQFVFGGETRMLIDKGSVELCPKPSTTGQQISLYGAKASSAPGSPQLSPTGASNVVRFANPSRAFAIGEIPLALTSNASLDSSNPAGSMRLTGFDQTSIPAAATITSATLRVAHRESSTSAISALTVTVNPGVGGSITRTVPKTTSLTTHSFNLDGNLSTPAHFAGLSVDVSVTRASGSPTEFLDGIRLDVTYAVSPGYRAQSGCVIQVGGCFFIQTSSDKGRFLSHGTIYAPLAWVQFKHEKFDEAIARRGIVARALWIETKPNPGNQNQLVSLPSTTPSLTDRTVVLTALVNGEPHLRALVRFADLGGSAPGNTVEILRWSVLR